MKKQRYQTDTAAVLPLPPKGLSSGGKGYVERVNEESGIQRGEEG